MTLIEGKSRMAADFASGARLAVQRENGRPLRDHLPTEQEAAWRLRSVGSAELGDWFIANFDIANTDMQIAFMFCEAAFCRRIAAMMLARAEQIEATEPPPGAARIG